MDLRRSRRLLGRLQGLLDRRLGLLGWLLWALPALLLLLLLEEQAQHVLLHQYQLLLLGLLRQRLELGRVYQVLSLLGDQMLLLRIQRETRWCLWLLPWVLALLRTRRSHRGWPW